MIGNNRLLAASLVSLCFAFLILVISVNASSLEVSEDLVIVGNGTIDRDLRVQSLPGFAGQKFTETIYSAHGNHSSSSYISSLELIHSNNSTIYYESDSNLSNVKHFAFNKNYRLGVSTGFYFIGDQKKIFVFESSPFLSEAIVRSEAEGRSVICAQVVNFSEYHARRVDMLTQLDGNYTLDWNFLVLKPEYPEAGAEDWLLCPGGVVLP